MNARACETQQRLTQYDSLPYNIYLDKSKNKKVLKSKQSMDSRWLFKGLYSLHININTVTHSQYMQQQTKIWHTVYQRNLTVFGVELIFHALCIVYPSVL